MLLYAKKVDDERHIFGTMGTIPSDTDSQLSYVDDNDDPVVVSLSDSYFNDGHGGIKTSDGTSVNVILDNTVIIPKGGEMPLSDDCDITSFKIGNATGTITDTAIAVTVPKDTDVTALTPTIVISDGASVSPKSGVATDFTNAVTYTVTAANGTSTKAYTVTVTVATETADPENKEGE